MKKVWLIGIMACACAEVSGDLNRESADSVPGTEKSSQIPTYSELKNQYEKADAQQEKTKELLIKMKNRIKELTAQVLELSNSKSILERENTSLLEQIRNFQDNSMNNEDKIKSLNIKILNLEQEKEELLQKLFDHQMNTQEIKSVSFELNSLLNQISAEDEIAKDCKKLLQDLTDIDNRLDQILDSAQSVEINSERKDQIESILKELKTKQDIAKQKLNFFDNHEKDLITVCNKNKETLSPLSQIRDQLLAEQKKYPEIANLNLEKNFINSINVVKAFRQNKTAKQAAEIKLFEKKLYEYIKLNMKKANLQRLEHQVKDFSDNIVKAKEILADLMKKSKKLKEIKNTSLQTVEKSETIDNKSKARSKS
jgi:hypothetical protein